MCIFMNAYNYLYFQTVNTSTTLIQIVQVNNFLSVTDLFFRDTLHIFYTNSHMYICT